MGNNGSIIVLQNNSKGAAAMKVYVIMVETNGMYGGSAKVSQDAYTCLEAAQEFVINRAGWDETIEEINPYTFKIGSYTYTIVEVNVK